MNPSHAQEIYGDPTAPVAGKVLGTVIHTTDPDELRYVVLKQLTDRYAHQKGITVTQAEKDSYAEHLQALMEEDRRQKEARRDEVTRELASEGVPDAERRSLASELETLNALIASLDDLGQTAEADPEVEAARDQIADAFIRQWKINRALYQEYGGRVIYQQGGPEPLDAYREFLEERQQRGDFEILDEHLEAGFWRYYVTDSIHSFFAPGSEAERAFETPWWPADR